MRLPLVTSESSYQMSGSGTGYNGGSGYSSGYSRYNSSYQNNRSDYNASSNTIPASQRPDGSYREEIRVRPGYVPEGEKQAYVPPPARSSNYNSPGSYSNMSRTLSVDSCEERVDSWADESAPILSEVTAKLSEIENISEGTITVETVKADNVEIIETATDSSSDDEAEASAEPANTETVTTEVVREPRKPSQLATAIDTAIDSLNLGGSSGGDGSTRPIGRFATQIANDEKEGRPSYSSYRRYDSPSGSYNREGSSYYNRDSQGYNNYGSRSYYNNNGSSTFNRNRQSDSTSQQSETAAENRVEADFKTFLEDLSALRREMAVINAKLEYIRYVKAHDEDTITEVEAARLKLEPTLLARLDAIFESIDALHAGNK